MEKEEPKQEKIERTPEQQEQAIKLYKIYIQEIHRRQLSNTENYDKSLLTIASSSLGFSLLAIRYIVHPWEEATLKPLLIIAWVLMAVSISKSLYAYRVSNRALKQQERDTNDYYINRIKGALGRENTDIKLNKDLNDIAGIVFALSIVFLLLFVCLNLF
ncbi:MAG: hypothetical protein OXI02_00975 [Candidatus Dadabacteria bacterium]|nr:hypothetical protein [Candidatus Dadabacteria bacterium]MDE0476624.1 hypothetical protein [Candidatus Dadabacteria bacterium]